jgi:hypothetical protein
VDVKASLKRLMDHKLKLGFVDGPAISDMAGRLFLTKDMPNWLLEILEDLFDSDPSFSPPNIASKEILRERYQAFCSFRRTSDTRAAKTNVSSTNTDIVNCWKLVEKAQNPGHVGRHADALALYSD